MYKKIIVLLLVLLTLTACGSQELPEQTQATTPTEATQPTTEPVYVDPAEGLQVNWSEGNGVLLFTANDVAVYLRKTANWGNIQYTIQIENGSSVPMDLEISEVYFNDRYMSKNNQTISAEPGAWGAYNSGLAYPAAVAAGDLQQITRISFHAALKDGSLGWGAPDATLWEQDVYVNLSETAVVRAFSSEDGLLTITEPWKEFFVSQEQLLMEKDGVRVSLKKVGVAPGNEELTYLCAIENTSQERRHVVFNGVAVNDVYDSAGNGSVVLRPGGISYHYGCIRDLHGMEQIGSMKIGLGIGAGDYDYTVPVQIQWIDVIPQQAAAEPTPVTEGEVVLEDMGLRVSLLKEEKDYGGDPQWYVVVVNETDENLYLDAIDEIYQQTEVMEDTMYVSFSQNQVGPHQRAVMIIRQSHNYPVSFRLVAKDFNTYEPLFETQAQITLTPS